MSQTIIQVHDPLHLILNEDQRAAVRKFTATVIKKPCVTMAQLAVALGTKEFDLYSVLSQAGFGDEISTILGRVAHAITDCEDISVDIRDQSVVVRVTLYVRCQRL